jgi:DNA segregation ATPase FtsK/SpoIIIE, S-DNA-T family
MRRLTAEMVRAALCALDLPGLLIPSEIMFRTPIRRDGRDWRVRVELPAGVPATTVARRHRELAAALRVPVGQVLPVANAEHADQLDLWVDLDAPGAPR